MNSIRNRDKQQRNKNQFDQRVGPYLAARAIKIAYVDHDNADTPTPQESIIEVGKIGARWMLLNIGR